MLHHLQSAGRAIRAISALWALSRLVHSSGAVHEVHTPKKRGPRRCWIPPDVSITLQTSVLSKRSKGGKSEGAPSRCWRLHVSCARRLIPSGTRTVPVGIPMVRRRKRRLENPNREARCPMGNRPGDHVVGLSSRAGTRSWSEIPEVPVCEECLKNPKARIDKNGHCEHVARRFNMLLMPRNP